MTNITWEMPNGQWLYRERCFLFLTRLKFTTKNIMLYSTSRHSVSYCLIGRVPNTDNRAVRCWSCSVRMPSITTRYSTKHDNYKNAADLMYFADHTVYGPSQWGTALQCNASLIGWAHTEHTENGPCTCKSYDTMVTYQCAWCLWPLFDIIWLIADIYTLALSLRPILLTFWMTTNP